MSARAILLFLSVSAAGMLSYGTTAAQDYQAREVTDRVFAIRDSEDGNEEVVIVSDSGLVVLNSF